MTDAARARYAPANPESYSRRIGTVAEALDALVSIDRIDVTGDTVTLDARQQIVIANGITTITMPSAASMQGNFILIKNVSGSSTSVESTDDIEGSSSLLLASNASRSIYSTGTTWVVTGGYDPS